MKPETIAAIRSHAGLTQSALATKLGVTQPMVAMMENGLAEIPSAQATHVVSIALRKALDKNEKATQKLKRSNDAYSRAIQEVGEQLDVQSWRQLNATEKKLALDMALSSDDRERQAQIHRVFYGNRDTKARRKK